MDAVIIYSGGLDSTVLLADIMRRMDKVTALNFNYGSKHNLRERASARTICEKLGVDFVEIELPFINQFFKSDLLQSGGNIPEGRYEAKSMKSTVVPFRNGIMISIAAGYAESIGAQFVLLASHKGDASQYPDCREEFTKTINKAVQLGTYSNVKIESPFNSLLKHEIVKIGLDINAPMELSWSCYKGKERPCLKCGTCYERTEAFYLNDVKDSSLTNEEWFEALKVIGKDKDG